MKVFMHDIRAAGMCSKGVRRFAEKHDIDLNRFLEDGIDIDLLPEDDENIKALKKHLGASD